MKKSKKRLYVIIICIILIAQIIVIPNSVQAKTYTQTTKQGIENFPTDYQIYLNQLKELYPNWNFTAYYTGLTWSEFMTGENKSHYTNSVHKDSNALWKCSCGTLKSGYVCASKAITAYYADPRNFLGESTVFQFLEMSYNEAIHTEDGVKSVIQSSFMNTEVTFQLNGVQTTMPYSKIIMEAAKQSGISPYSIAIKIIQEVGSKGSDSVSGTYIASDGTNYSGYYNFFNYGSYDSGNAIENGLKYAKDKGWNNQYIAIIEGAKLMANNYINVGQNTAYFYKWDVVGNKDSDFFNHQYMTNVKDPTSQSSSLFNTYAKNNLLNQALNFVIPIYENMPIVNALPSAIDSSLSTSYYVTGTDVRIRDNYSTSASIVAYPEKYEVVTLLEWYAGSANGYDWAQVKTANGTIGYIANKYLSQCNPPTEIAKIDGEYLIIVPNKTVQEIGNYFSATTYSSEKQDKTQLGANDIVGTGYTYILEDKIYTAIVLGDVYLDAIIDSRDYMKIKNHIMGKSTLNELEVLAANVYDDDLIDSRDYMKIKNHIMGTSTITF